jgi:hypothetical protein
MTPIPPMAYIGPPDEKKQDVWEEDPGTREVIRRFARMFPGASVRTITREVPS